jgi:hypothetical protein
MVSKCHTGTSTTRQYSTSSAVRRVRYCTTGSCSSTDRDLCYYSSRGTDTVAFAVLVLVLATCTGNCTGTVLVPALPVVLDHWYTVVLLASTS